MEWGEKKGAASIYVINLEELSGERVCAKKVINSSFIIVSLPQSQSCILLALRGRINIFTLSGLGKSDLFSGAGYLGQHVWPNVKLC